MTWSIIQDGNMMQEAVGPKTKGRLPGPAIQPLIDRQKDKPMSELQHMMSEEKRQHEDLYRYSHGHNDHGLGG